MFFRLSAIIISLLSLAMPLNAAILEVNGDGKLIGATNIDVGGTLYDVSFVEGTCISVFSGCDSAADFTFQTAELAELASQALIDQVLLGDFDSNAGLTYGCTDNAFLCYLTTPYALNGNEAEAKAAGNTATAKFLSNRFYFSDYDTSIDGAGVYAVWSGSITPVPVPVPATAWLFGSGLLGLVGIARRKKAV